MTTRARWLFVVLAAGIVVVAVLFVPLPRGTLPDTRIVSVVVIQRAPASRGRVRTWNSW